METPYERDLPGATGLTLSYVPGDGCPGHSDERLGFAPTGEVADGVIVMRRTL